MPHPVSDMIMTMRIPRTKDRNAAIVSKRMTWKYEDDKCRCGLVEREGWRGAVRDLKDGMEEYEIIKGYRVRSENRK